ncbi:MAG: threonine ammonia-lyase [Halobacteriales archaeon]
MGRVALADIKRADDRIDDEDVVMTTPIEESRSLSRMAGANVRLKMEHLQRTGSFKTRGAYNKLTQLAAEGYVEQVVAASAGNHAQGVALAATKTGLDSTIVMPQTAPQTKINATASYGAEVVLEGNTFQEAVEHARTLADADRTAFIHAYDDPDIVAGQGTLGLEMYTQLPAVDTVIVPIGGGGLIGGIATAIKSQDADIRIVGVQAEEAATVPQSLKKGVPVDIDDPDTIADGIATGGISELTLELIDEHVDEIVLVSDDEIANAMLILLERAKQLVEGSGAASVAGLLSPDLDVTDELVLPVLCGGNIDPSMLQIVLTYALTERDQLLDLQVRIDDEPGQMGMIAGLIGQEGANIRTVRHDRAVGDLHVGEAYLVFEVVTGGEEHAQRVIEAIESGGYEVSRVN